MNHAEKDCVREADEVKIQTPEGVTVHAVKDTDGRLHGHMIIIGSLEAAATITPFLMHFGLTAEGIASVLGLMVFTSPVMIPLILFVDVVGSLSLIALEEHLRRHRQQNQELPPEE